MTYKLKYIELSVITCIIIAFGWTAYQRNFVWRDNFSLYFDAVSKSPGKARARHNLAIDYYNKGLYSLAIAEYKETIRLNPEDIEAYFNLGLAYQVTGLTDLAMEKYREFLQIYEKNYPVSFSRSSFHCSTLGRKLVEVHNNMGVCFFRKGDIDGAIKEFNTTLSLDPDHSNAQYNLDVIKHKSQQSK